MDQNTQQVAVALQGIVDQYEMILEIDTGDEMADEQYRHGVESVLGDIKSLLNEMADGTFNYTTERPFIPAGFKLHAVHH